MRTILLRQVALDALARHLSTYPPGEQQLVFTNEHGDPISRTREAVDAVLRGASPRSLLALARD